METVISYRNVPLKLESGTQFWKSSNVKEVIRVVLNSLLFFFYKKILQAQKASKAPKAQQPPKTQKHKDATKQKHKTQLS